MIDQDKNITFNAAEYLSHHEDAFHPLAERFAAEVLSRLDLTAKAGHGSIETSDILEPACNRDARREGRLVAAVMGMNVGKAWGTFMNILAEFNQTAHVTDEPLQNFAIPVNAKAAGAFIECFNARPR